MNKQQLTRLLVVLAVGVAIVFVPYWVAIFIDGFMNGLLVNAPIVLVWFLGMLILGLCTLMAIGLWAELKPIINYIKNGKL